MGPPSPLKSVVTGTAVLVRKQTPPWDAKVDIPKMRDREEDPTQDHREHTHEETPNDQTNNEDPNRDHRNAIDHTVPSAAPPRTRWVGAGV